MVPAANADDPVFMFPGWFKKHLCRMVNRKGISVLLWKTFSEEARPPRWIKANKIPERVPGKVVVTALANGCCSGTNGMIERAKKICSEFGDHLIFHEIDLNSREPLWEWGLPDGLFVDERNIHRGPPLSCDKIRKIIEKKVGKL